MTDLNINSINDIKAKIGEYYHNDALNHVIAVSKTKTVAHIKAVYALGFRHFGENYIQEAAVKIHAIACNKNDYSDITWHFIGHLQSNKAKQAVELFDVIGSIHSLKLIKKLNHHSKQLNKPLAVFIAVNLAEEPQKSGCALADLEAILLYTQNVSQLSLKGLMCIPPAGENPVPYFQKLKQLADFYTGKLER